MGTRYFQVTLGNKQKKNKKGEYTETQHIYPLGWDSQSITVRAYKSKKDGLEWCICEIDDQLIGLINELLKDGNVKEINESSALARIKEARPTIHVHVALHKEADQISPGIETAIEDFLDSKDVL